MAPKSAASLNAIAVVSSDDLWFRTKASLSSGRYVRFRPSTRYTSHGDDAMAVEIAWMHAQTAETLVASSAVRRRDDGIHPNGIEVKDVEGSTGRVAAARIPSADPTRLQNPTRTG